MEESYSDMINRQYWEKHSPSKAKTTKPKRWSRKGRCPSCNVSQGSSHSNNCHFIYLPVAKFS